ncbi:hypothetical protein [Chitinophaga sp. 212800010-3]|uniref:hypothetical protein n=1 Tax=unclassified Chitinophaga TaxID=2619133 RepID=UPI002DEB51C7|nr:tRNA-synt-2 domain-containing protein [Chitinophaga sp. 212800010-3]
MKTPYLIYCTVAFNVLLHACQTTPRKNQEKPLKDTIIPTTKVYDMNLEEIKKHIQLQLHIEKQEEGDGPLYNYTAKDIEIALPLIAEGLKNENYVAPDSVVFDRKIRQIFGDIFTKTNNKVRLRNKFNTILVEANMNEEQEFDYTVDNLFISKEYRFITYVPFLADIVEFSDSSHYTITMDPRLAALNKYFFNGSRSDLAFLIGEDDFFMKTLVKSFGYTKEPRLNDLAMNDYLDLGEIKAAIVGEIIFLKNGDQLDIKTDLLQWIANHTTRDNNTLLSGLSYFADAMYDSLLRQAAFQHHPYHYYTLNEKRKIVAYISAIYEPLFYEYYRYNTALWPRTPVLDQIMSVDKGLFDYLEKNHYFFLPGLKEYWADQ